MANVSRLYSEKPVSAEVNDALSALTGQVTTAIQEAKDAGVPQGLIVAILSACWHEQTARMLEIRDQMLCEDS